MINLICDVQESGTKKDRATAKVSFMMLDLKNVRGIYTCILIV